MIPTHAIRLVRTRLTSSCLALPAAVSRSAPAAFPMLIALWGCAGGDASGSEPTARDDFSEAPVRGPRTYDFLEVSRLVDGVVTRRDLSGAGLIVVDREDGIVHEEYWGGFDAERISLVASASKMLSAGVLARLHDEGLLDMDAPVADVVEWGAGHPEITPAQLLSNSSGLVGIYPNPAYAPYLCQYLPLGTLRDCAESIFTTADDDADIVPPDTAFRYGGAQWQVAGAVAEAASGRSWAELIEETYLQPCGLDSGSLGYNNPITQMGNGIDYPTEFDGDPSTLVPTDNPNVESGAYAKPRAIAGLLLAYLRGGECGEGQRALSEHAIDRMLADRVAATYGGSAAPGVGYGMGWWIHRQSGLAYSTGAYGAVPALRMDEGFGYYVVLEANDAAWQALATPLTAAIEEAVLAARD